MGVILENGSIRKRFRSKIDFCIAFSGKNSILLDRDPITIIWRLVL